jgi:hypothetical protein
MANVYRPKKPLRRGGAYIFPRTTVDQVYTDPATGKMLDEKLAEMEDTMADAAAVVNDATSLTSGTATRDDTYTFSGSVKWLKCGRLVQVSVLDLGLNIYEINAMKWTAFTVATGLPRAAEGGTAYEHLYIEGAQSNAGRFRVTGDGSLIFYHHDATLTSGGTTGAVDASGVITYIAE